MRDNMLEITLGTIMAVVLLLGMALIVDMVWTESIQHGGTVVGRYYIPEKTGTRVEYDILLKMPKVVPDHHPARYYLYVEDRDTYKTFEVRVDPPQYQNIEDGTQVIFTERVGKLLGIRTNKDIRWMR